MIPPDKTAAKPRRKRAEAPVWATLSDDPAPQVDDRETLLEMLAQQQRVAQAGLVTSALAHDVKNHIQVMSGTAYLALNTDDPAEWRAALEGVQDQCRALTETTRAFLAFVKRRGADEAWTFHVAEAARQAVRLVGTFARAHGAEISLVVDGDGSVKGEQRLAIQAIVNLLTNAVQALDGGGHIALITRRSPFGGLQIVVEDDGPGIPENVRKRLFRPFETSRAKNDGHGLGLFVVRQTVRKLGGTIRVRTSPAGTRFTIELPVAPDAD